MSDSVRPHRRQPTRLPHPRDSTGKNTGVGCHFLLQCMKVKSETEVAQSCLTPSDPMDCSPPGSSVHGIFQARVLEWGCHCFLQLSPARYPQTLNRNGKMPIKASSAQDCTRCDHPAKSRAFEPWVFVSPFGFPWFCVHLSLTDFYCSSSSFFITWLSAANTTEFL